MAISVRVATFHNPFSFFCVSEDGATKKDIKLPDENVGGAIRSKMMDFSGVSHGQYVAVYWNNSWARGIISLEAQFLIWLVDYGMYMRPTEKTVYVNLPPEYKKYPTKVFEASIHGVAPVDKIINDECQIENTMTTAWCGGVVETTEKLLQAAVKVYFVPFAMLSTKVNDVVMGDLYLKFKDKGLVSLEDILGQWPVFLEKDKEFYIQNLSKFYTTRRQHRACLLKPAFPDTKLPTITPVTTLPQYNAICALAPQLDITDADSESEDGSTVTYIETVCGETRNAFKLTPAEIEKYSNEYIIVAGQEYNVLNVLRNKARDLYMCEKYKDLKSVGRANSRRSSEHEALH